MSSRFARWSGRCRWLARLAVMACLLASVNFDFFERPGESMKIGFLARLLLAAGWLRGMTNYVEKKILIHFMLW